MLKLVAFAAVLAVSQASLILPAGYAGLPAATYAGLPAAGYAGLPLHGALPYAAPIAAAPIAAPIAAAPVAAASYALPPVREYANAPIIEKSVEPVEQHGYSIRY